MVILNYILKLSISKIYIYIYTHTFSITVILNYILKKVAYLKEKVGQVSE